MPRIILITEDFPPRLGGIATWSLELARALARVGADVTVLARGPAGEEPVRDPGEGFDLIRMGGRDWPTWRGWHVRRALGVLLESPDEDVGIVAANWILGLGVAPHRGAVGGRTLVFGHGQEVRKAVRGIPRWRMRRSCLKAGVCAGVSRYVADLFESCGVPGERVRVIHGGVDTDHFSPGPPDEGLARRLGLGEGPVIVSVARIIPRKGQDVLVEAMPRILQEHPGAKLLLVGEGSVVETERIRDLAAGLGITDRVLMPGSVPYGEVPDYYRLADVAVMVSRERAEAGDVEGFGLTFLEAGAVGLPVVGGRSGGMEDAVVEGWTGLLCEPTDPGDVARAVSSLLADTDEAGRMGQRGQARARAEFTWEHTARRTLDALGLGP